MLQQVGLLLTSVWAGSPFLQRVPFPTEPFCLHSKAGWAPRGGGARGSPCPFVPPDGCPDLCNGNGRCTLGQNSWQCVCQSGWRGPGCSVAMETACADSKDNEGGEPGPGAPAPHSGCAGGSLQHRTGSCAGRDTQGARREAVPAPERSGAELPPAGTAVPGELPVCPRSGQRATVRASSCPCPVLCSAQPVRLSFGVPQPLSGCPLGPCSPVRTLSGGPLLSYSPCRPVPCCLTAPLRVSLALPQPLPACPLLSHSPYRDVLCCPLPSHSPCPLLSQCPVPVAGSAGLAGLCSVGVGSGADIPALFSLPFISHVSIKYRVSVVFPFRDVFLVL